MADTPATESTTPPVPSLDEQRLQATIAQTEAIRAQTDALIAARQSAENAQAAIVQAVSESPGGLSESFVLELLRLVLEKPAP